MWVEEASSLISGQTVNMNLCHDEFSGQKMLQHTYDFVFIPSGYGVREKDGGTGVCGIQQCHVSVLSNALEVFYVSVSLFSAPKSKDGVRQIACPLPRCIIDVSVSNHPASLSQVPVRKRNRRQKFCHWILHEREEGRLQNAEICGIRNALIFCCVCLSLIFTHLCQTEWCMFLSHVPLKSWPIQTGLQQTIIVFHSAIHLSIALLINYLFI